MASINGSDESWGICSPKDIRSISSGIESNDFFDIESRTSNPNAPFNLLQTTESIDGTVDMEFAAESQGHSPSQTFLPHPTNITEWVQGQSIPMSEPSEPKAKSHNLLETTSGSAEVRRALSENLSQCSKVPSRSRSIYDISTLLAIGAVTPSDRMELRIRPAVLTGEICVHFILFKLIQILTKYLTASPLILYLSLACFGCQSGSLEITELRLPIHRRYIQAQIPRRTV